MDFFAAGLILFCVVCLGIALRCSFRERATRAENDKLSTRNGELRREAELERAKFDQLRRKLV